MSSADTAGLPRTRLPQNPAFVLRGDCDRPVHARQWFEFPGRGDGVPETWCYTDRLSYAAGEKVTLFAISTEALVDVQVRSETLRPALMLELRSVAVAWSDTPESASATGCDWPSVAEFTIGVEWPSGIYRITVRPCTPGAEGQDATHLIVVRPSPGSRPGRLLLVTADATWTAYNDWGGSNHYEGVVDPRSKRFSPHLSTQRPFARGFVTLPPEAPRTVPDRPPPFGAPIRYPHMDWAWRHGYSKKYASAGWASYEKYFAHWAEAQGYALDIATQQDLHHRPDVLDGAACLIHVGHDEYWSWAMRDAVDSYVDRGGRVARFAGNFFWQIRLEQSGRVQTCHKYLAETEDPLRNGPERYLTTNCWEAAVLGRPGHATFGLDGSRGLYAGWGGLAARGPGGFTLYRPEHWAFAGTGLGYGDILGLDGRIFGYEVDGLDYRIEDGLPFPVAKPDLPEGLEILALGLARLREDGGSGPQEGDAFVGDDDARFLARLRFGTDSEDALARADRGSGMIVGFTRGEGHVFHAGTTEWVAGLIRHDPAVEQVTRNVLNRFLERS